jgi:hypothetical protein
MFRQKYPKALVLIPALSLRPERINEKSLVLSGIHPEKTSLAICAPGMAGMSELQGANSGHALGMRE